MKTLLKFALPTLALSLTATAHAADVSCTDAGIVNSGFTAVIHDNRQSVVLTQITTDGSQIVSEEIPCARQDVDPLASRAGDVVLTCRKEGTADHGYIFSVRSQDHDGGIAATLSRATIAGNQLVAQMRCAAVIPEDAAQGPEEQTPAQGK